MPFKVKFALQVEQILESSVHVAQIVLQGIHLPNLRSKHMLANEENFGL